MFLPPSPSRRPALLLFFTLALARAQPASPPGAAILAATLADDSAHEFLEHLCDDFGGRLTGSPNNRAALARLAAELKSLGLDARLDPFDMPGWVRGDDEVLLLSPLPAPRRLRVAALSYTQPHAPFEADVVDIGQGREQDFDPLGDVRGKVGLLAADTTVPRGQHEAAAVRRGLRGVLFVNREPGGQLLARTGGFSGAPLAVPVYSITQEEGRWLARLLARGAPVRVRLTTRSHCEKITTANLIVRLPGRTPDTLLVGAHFDSWDLGQGAMDNGLGLAQLLAVAHALKKFSPQNLRTVELVWFNGEEQGLFGSRHHAATTAAAPLVAMLNLDMVGFPLSLNACGHPELVPALRRVAASLPLERLRAGVVDTCWLASDHTPYQLAGVRVVTLGAHLEREQNRYYHDLADTVEKIDPRLLRESSATLACLVHALANDPDPALTPARRTPAATAEIFRAAGLEARLRGLGLWNFPP